MTASSVPRSSALTARHRAAASPLRRGVQLVLLFGAALSIAAVFGPIWVVRVGVLMALVTVILVARLTRRELAEVRDEYAERAIRTLRDHQSALERERRRQTVDREAARAAAHAAESRLRAAIGEEQQVSGALRVELADLSRTRVVQAEQLSALGAEIRRLRAALASVGEADETLADIRLLPRHGLVGPDEQDEVGSDAGVDAGGLDHGHHLAGGRADVLRLHRVDPGWDNLEVDVARG